MKTNTVQKNYMVAKEALKEIKGIEEQAEQDFIREMGIKNKDGKAPKMMFAIENEAEFEKAVDEYETLMKKTGLWEKVLKAEEQLTGAEADLIRYGLSIAPTKQRNILSEAIEKGNYKIRKELIEITMKLDTSTVK